MSTENIFEEVEKENNKNSDYMDELSPEELAELMSRYKQEFTNFQVRKKLPYLLKNCIMLNIYLISVIWK